MTVMMSAQDIEDARAQLEQDRAAFEADKAQYEKEKAEFEDERKESGLEYKLFIGNLDDSTTDDEVRAYAAPYGTVKEVYLLKDHSGKSKRSCFVKYYTKKAAETCVQALNNLVKDKNSIKSMVVRWADQSSNPRASSSMSGPSPGVTPSYNNYDAYAQAPSPYQPYAQAPMSAPSSYGPTRTNGSAATVGRGPSGSNLYINNLASGSSDQDVQAMFADFGTVLSAKVFANHGYGFVSYDNPQSAQYAIQALNGLQLGDAERRLEVSLKKEGGGGSSRFSPY